MTFGQDPIFVDQSGAFQYNYPINLPPGTNGMGPSLALIYNSNIGNGMLGVGWALSGFPTITRDSSYGINFDGNDHFLYEGQKLIFNSSDGYYHTEKESYIRIKAWNMDTSSSYWEVMLKNGTKMYFGWCDSDHSSSNDGHIDAVDKGGKALLWTLSKVIDVYGNYYFIEYNEDTTNGDYYPIKITYTKNQNLLLQAFRTIELSYEIRNDHSPLNIPTKVDMDRRLKWVTVKVGGNLLRKYRLDYEYEVATGRSKLVTIQIGPDRYFDLPGRRSDDLCL